MHRRAILLGAVLFAIVTVISLRSPAQGPPPDSRDRELTAAQRTEIIESALQKLNDTYIFPETAKKMEAAIRERVARKEYDSVSSSRAFAGALTEHLQAVSHDRHLRVLFSYDPPSQQQTFNPELARLQAEFNNFGFAKVERLAGNVGYLDLRGFSGDPAALDVAAAAMNFLAGSRALIVDLRQNGGGSPVMVAFLSSYIFGPEPVHLNDLYWRAANRTDSFYTRKDVPGKRFGPDKPVFVLTSGRTFSAAEEFTYNLKCLKRATIVGENTRGGAHPGGAQRINDNFAIWIPSGRAINPITKTNWEGTGVAPDVPTTASDALKAAHVLALKKIQETNKDASLAEAIQSAIAEVQRTP